VLLAEAKSGMIQARITISAQPNQREQLVHTIYKLIESCRRDASCLGCQLYSDVANPYVLTLVEEWASWNDMERRLRSASYGQLLQLMEVSAERPETIFHTITKTSGLETIRNVRLQFDRV
jgi:quinol monooxygenase YgiN